MAEGMVHRGGLELEVVLEFGADAERAAEATEMVEAAETADAEVVVALTMTAVAAMAGLKN